MSYNRRVLNTTFQNWLNEEIYTSKGLTHAPRKYVLWSFIEDLCTYIKSEGYSFGVPEKEIVQAWARYLFQQRNMRKQLAFKRNPDERPEDYDWYCHKFDFENVSPFVNEWTGCDDFPEDTTILFDAFMFAWYFIDINSSSETQKVDELIGDMESDEETTGQKQVVKKKPNGDPYLEDQANAASKYNRWD